MFQKIACINISIPYKGPGNTINQNPVSFDVYSDAGNFKAVALLNEDERRIANLPQELLFNYEQGRAVSRRGKFEGNFHAIEDIVLELQNRKLI